MYKKDLALNDLQWLICHKKNNQPTKQPINPLLTECDTRSFFKWRTTGRNSEFYFSYTGCRTKTKESSLPNSSWCNAGFLNVVHINS